MTGLASASDIETNTAASIVSKRGRTARISTVEPGSLYAGAWITQ